MENKIQSKKNKSNELYHIITKIIITLSIISIILIGGIYFLLTNINQQTIKIYKNYNNIENIEIKKILKNEFNIDNNTYVRKIKYTRGLDDGNIWKICAYYNKTKKTCKSATEGPFNYNLPN